MYVVTAIDDYRVKTRITLNCDGPVDDVCGKLFSAGFAVGLDKNVESIDRSPDEIARAQSILKTLYEEQKHV